MTATIADQILAAELEDGQLAAVVAYLIERIGFDAVRSHLTQTAVQPPPPGVAVMACACGQMLNLAEMRRMQLVNRAAVIDPIVCADCERDRAW
jgi:hypothetical protein